MTPGRIVEVHVRPPDLASLDPNAPIVTMEKDDRGVWWHGVGGKLVRRATTLESILPLAPAAWRRLGTPGDTP